MKRLPASLRAMLVASLLIPLLFLIGASWYDRHRLMAEVHADVDRLSAIAREHALKVVETNALVLDRMEDRIRGLAWPQIAQQGEQIQAWLRDLDLSFAQITTLHFARPDGEVALLSNAWPTPPINIAERAYFKAAAAGETGLIFGEPVRPALTGIVSFIVAHRLHSPDGSFQGVAVGSILPGYFQAQWHAMDPEGKASFALVRTDGQVLVAHPSGGQDLHGPPDPETVPEAIRHPNPVGATTQYFGDRQEWLTAFRQVGQQPLVVAVTFSMDRVQAEWLGNTAITAALCLFAALALGFSTWLAIRRWRSEQQTLLALRAEISRREAAEAGLVQAQRLESMGRLTGGVAHDFNNLLTAILGTVHLLERHLGAGLDDRSRRLLGAARDAVQRGAALNRSLLAFARRQKLDTASLDANDLLRGFAPLIQRALGEEVTLDIALEPDLPPCRADAAQLESALLNLAINARDAMPRGGAVRITTRQARLNAALLDGNSDARPGDYLAISVRDDGIGMPAEVRDRAFEPFFTTKPVGRGTGLGLSQVFGFMRQLGGHIALESNPGEGTLVTLYVPMSDEPVARAQPAPPVPNDMAAVARATILVVEDDDRVRDVTAETMREAGFRVIAVQNGPEALALIRRGEQFDVLFSDIVMPGGLDGIELAQAARGLRPSLPVLLATGYAGRGTDSADHGFEVITKPYDQVAVVRRIAELAARQRRSVA